MRPGCEYQCAPGKDPEGYSFTKCKKGCRGICKMSGCNKPCYPGRDASGRRITKCKIKCNGAWQKEICEECGEECDSLYVSKEKRMLCKICIS